VSNDTSDNEVYTEKLDNELIRVEAIQRSKERAEERERRREEHDLQVRKLIQSQKNTSTIKTVTTTTTTTRTAPSFNRKNEKVIFIDLVDIP
jgi:hypothetical protein